jgi:hypothetical protein
VGAHRDPPLDEAASFRLGYLDGWTAATATDVPNAASHGWIPQTWEADMKAFWEGKKAAIEDAIAGRRPLHVANSATMES